MRIFNQDKTIELKKEDCDPALGYLSHSFIVTGQRNSLIEEIDNGDETVSTTVYPSIDIVENILVYIPYTERELLQIEKNECEEWFRNNYTYKEQKYRRLVSLGLTDDDGIDAQFKLTDLYFEAEQKRKRIQELEVLISTGI